MGTRCATRRWCAFIPSAAADLRLCHPPSARKPRLPRYARVYYTMSVPFRTIGLWSRHICFGHLRLCARRARFVFGRLSNRIDAFGVFFLLEGGVWCLVPAFGGPEIEAMMCRRVVVLASLFAIATIAITEPYAELGPELTHVKYLCVLCLPCFVENVLHYELLMS